jgi:uncharacterized protein GlcG (DUF336 family)
MTKAFERHSITLDAADRVASAAIEKAKEIGAPIVVSVLDESGILKAFRRMDGAPLMSIDVADRKAYTALFGLPTSEFFQSIKDDPALIAGVPHIPRITVFGGGLPIRDGDRVIGAIGVSGATTEQDILCAQAALATID